MTSWMQVSCTTHWTICTVECCSSFFHFFVFNLLWNATTLTHGDKLGWWVYGVRQLNCWCRQSQVSYRHGRWTDRQTDGQVCIYILLLPFNDLLLWVWKDNIYTCMHLVHPYVYTYTYIHTHTCMHIQYCPSAMPHLLASEHLLALE